MAKKKKPHEKEPPEIPAPANPEIIPGIPEEPFLPEEEPEILPEKDPGQPKSPPELPEEQ